MACSAARLAVVVSSGRAALPDVSQRPLESSLGTGRRRRRLRLRFDIDVLVAGTVVADMAHGSDPNCSSKLQPRPAHGRAGATGSGLAAPGLCRAGGGRLRIGRLLLHLPEPRVPEELLQPGCGGWYDPIPVEIRFRLLNQGLMLILEA
jgi:hypothetical protein